MSVEKDKPQKEKPAENTDPKKVDEEKPSKYRIGSGTGGQNTKKKGKN